MSDVTRILSKIEAGDPQAAEQLLPLIYDELRKLAAAKLAQEKPGQTLQATALVHEVYLRLMGPEARGSGLGTGDGTSSISVPTPSPQSTSPVYNSRGHFFAAAAEAMRRILVESIRRKQSVKHGGGMARADAAMELVELPSPPNSAETLAVHEILDLLAAKYPRKAEVVKLRYFLGCSQQEAGQILGISEDAVQADWQFARAWLKRQWREGAPE